jgi:hypothetical protein
MLKALLVSNIAGLLRAMLPGFSNAYAGSISAVCMCIFLLGGDVVVARRNLGTKVVETSTSSAFDARGAC